MRSSHRPLETRPAPTPWLRFAPAVLCLACLPACFTFKASTRFSSPDDAGADGASDAPTADAPGTDGSSPKVPVPSFVGEDNWHLLYAEGTKAVLLDATAVLDSDTGEVFLGAQTLRSAGERLDKETGIGFHVVSQGAGAPKLGVFYAAAWTIADDETVTGQGKNALVLLASGPIVVSGTLDLSATGRRAGPGGWDGANAFVAPGARLAPNGGADETITDGLHYGAQNSGGGGGGNGGTGGDGAPGTHTSLMGDKFPKPPGGDSQLGATTLAGGGGGGPGIGTNYVSDTPATCCTGTVTNPGGGGGGAVLLGSAERITVNAGGVITSAGAGGLGETMPSVAYLGPGSGGGAGGTIVLEAPEVTVAGTLTANGGAGAGGDGNSGEDAPTAPSGSTTTDARAPGGALATQTAMFPMPSNGGAGGAGTFFEGSDAPLPPSGGAGGGGGGSVGRLLIHALGSNVTLKAGATLSPKGEGPTDFVTPMPRGVLPAK